LFLYALGVVALMIRSRRLRQHLARRLKWQPDENTRPRFRGLKHFFFLTGLSLAIVAAMGPQWGEKPQRTTQEALDLCVALDLSQSMLVEDQSPSRLQAAKNQLRLFVERLRTDRISLVGFSGSAFVASPLTIDHNAFLTFLDPLDPTYISDTSTRLESGMEACLDALRLRNPDENVDSAARVILLVSDGEVTSESDSDVLKEIEQTGVRVFAMAMGTRSGGPIPKRNDEGVLEGYFRDPQSGQAAVSKMDDKAMKDITSKANGQVFYSTDGQSAWASFEASINELQRRAKEGTLRIEREERFWPFVMAALLILLVDFLLSEKRWIFLVLMGLSSWVASPSVSQAADSPPPTQPVEAPAPHRPRDPRSTWLSWRAFKIWEGKNPAPAEDALLEALTKDAADPVLRYNLATHELLQTLLSASKSSKDTLNKSFNESVAEFESLARLETAPLSLRAQAAFQAGLSRENLGRVPEALKWYYEAMTSDASSPELVEKARKSIQRLLVASQGGGSGGGGDGSGSQENSESGQGEGKPQKFSEGKGQAKPKFSGTDLSEAQARQILESVRGEERDVQAKKSRAQAKEAQGRSSETGRADSANSKPW
jgi:Ca-activated chloride channel family protein